MNYQHCTIEYDITGESPGEIISNLESEGYKSIFSKIIKRYYNSLNLDDPFNYYTQIVRKKPGELEFYFRTHEKQYSNLFDLEVFFQNEKSFSFGDLFTNESNTDVLYSLYIDDIEGNDRIWLCCWTLKNIDLVEYMTSFINAFLKVCGCDKPFEEILRSNTYESTHNEIIETLSEYKLNEAKFSEKKEVFEILSDKNVRDMLIELNIKSNVLLSDFIKDIEDEEDRKRQVKLLNFLVGKEILNKELIVICNKTDEWWNVTIPSKEAMKEIEKLQLTCTSCGAKINDERIDELFKISEYGKTLIEGSYWMVGKIVKELIKSQVRENDIYINVTLDSEEIDIIFFHMGNIIAMELKDREFGLGDAYKFHGKVSRLIEKTKRVIYPVIVTTKNVASEAQKLLNEVMLGRSRSNYVLIETLDEFDDKLIDLFETMIMSSITTRISEIKHVFPAILIST